MERNPYLIEVVASTVHSCIEAEQGGAGRIELCSALGAAGITPSSGLLEVVKRHIQIPVYAMIRPREGDFTYSASEIEVMKREIDLLGASGADGFVFGILKSDGTIDTAVTRQLVDHCSGTPVTFHRAIDCTPSLLDAVAEIASCGCERILTSGGKSTGPEGKETILAMVEAAGGAIRIMPGGGIKPETFDKMYHPSINEYHLSGRMQHRSPMASTLFDMDWAETTRENISHVVYRP
ncbi:MAG: copper homeostasis protein CutC [Flavobacteriales bacterium]|jgi:copper homeostasis protein